MEDLRFDRLSPRHRDCLRLAYAHRTTKEIARDLGIGAGTVNGDLAEASAILGARNRRDAAIMLHRFETPGELQGHSSGVSAAPAPPLSLIPDSSPPSHGGPLDPRNRDADNDYSIFARIGWVIFLAAALAVGYGAIAGGTHTFSQIYVALRDAR